MKTKFIPGNCVNCGVQTWIKTPNGVLAHAIEGTYLGWICLCDSQNEIVTRVGSVSFCATCGKTVMDPEELLGNLALNQASGWTGKEHELQHLSNRKIEIVKRFGD